MDKIGPGLWHQLHWAAHKADTSDNNSYFNTYINAYPEMIPCNVCKIHMNEYIINNGIPSRNYLKWTVEFHNSVNKRLNKPIMSFNQVIDKLLGKTNDECNTCDEI